MKFTLVLVVLFSQCLNSSLPTWADEPEIHPLVREIIEQERQWNKKVQTFYSESLWETQKGSAQRYHNTTIRRDDVGRVRYLEKSGSGQWDTEAGYDATREWVNTGEAVISIRLVPQSFSDGRPIQLVPQTVVYDAPYRIPIRNPLALGRIAEQLQTVIEAGGSVVVRSGSDEVKILEWTHPANNEKWSAEIIRFEGKSCVKRLFSKMPEGILGGGKTEIEKYRMDASGVLVAERAILEFYYTRSMLKSLAKIAKLKGNPPPQYKKNDIKYTLIDFRINVPGDFPEGTFKVK